MSDTTKCQKKSIRRTKKKRTAFPAECFSGGLVFALSLLAVFFLGGIGAVPASYAQVTVAPTALFLGEQNPYGTFFVNNQSTQPQEITIEPRFGFPTTDEEGNVVMAYEESAASLEEKSLGRHMRIFPKQFEIQPGAKQIVRIMATPSGEASSSFMWTRLVTTATPAVDAAPEEYDPEEEEGLQAELMMRISQVTAVIYKGSGSSATLSMPSARAQVLRGEADSLDRVIVDASFDKEGEAPYYGSIEINLENEEGEVVASEKTSLAVYESQMRRFVLNTGALDEGSYTANIKVTTKRNDIAPRNETNGNDFREEVDFQVSSEALAGPRENGSSSSSRER